MIKNLFFRKRNKWRILVFAIILFALVYFLLSLFFPLNTKVNYSTVILSRDGKIIHAFLSSDQKWRMEVSQEEISPELEKAILFKEDKWFYYHFGINPIAIFRAAFNNIVKGKRTSGASTITMQVARLLQPRKRTVGSKFIEMFRALQLEMNYSKKDILRMYLNLVPYGGNVEGIKSASLLYFGTSPEKLSLARIVTLAVVPNKPNSLNPGRRGDNLKDQRNKWLRKMEAAHIFSKKDIEVALSEFINITRREAPKTIPQLANRLRNLYSSRNIIQTTIVSSLQDKAVTLAYNYSKRLKYLNINNAAVIIINNKTRSVEAYIGSADPNDYEHGGLVDGVVAVRSPGSTLKPLIYGLGMDLGFCTPKTVIDDVPTNFDGYTPENYNAAFNGKVTVEKSLAYSLNIPAVKVLAQSGVRLFIDKLKFAGFNQIKKDENKLGLSVALGGCGVTLEQLSALYSAFANSGSWQPLKYIENDTSKFNSQVISPSAAFLISEILTKPERPDLPNNFLSSYHLPKVAWKTGTSYGRRDVWSIGYNQEYTIGVWFGNFSGEGVPEMSGAETATPLLFELFNSISYNTREKWFAVPEKLDYRLVCSESGRLPDDFCNEQIIDYYLPGVSSVEKCSHKKMVFLSPDESISYCTSCLPPSGFKKRLFPNLSPEIAAYYESEHIVFEKIPDHNPLCTRIFNNEAPQITSPVNKKEYILSEGSDQRIQLSCIVANEVSKVHWYIDDRFFKTVTPSEKVFFNPESSGLLKISCTDDKGRNANIRVMINRK